MKLSVIITIIASIEIYAEELFMSDYAPDKLDVIFTGNEETVKWSDNFDTESLIWGSYEFGTGVGNREELLITNIEIWQSLNLYKNIDNWQVLELVEEEIYLVGTTESTLLLYKFNMQSSNVTLCANMSVSGKIKSFKMIKLAENVEIPSEDNIYLILSVEVNSNVYNLKWFHLVNCTFAQLWIWSLEKPVKALEYFNFNDHHKLMLLYEDSFIFHEVFSLLEIYEFQMSGNLLQRQLCHYVLMPQISSFQICPSREDKLIVSLSSADNLLLYEYKDEDLSKCIFIQIQSITITGLENAICFESGNMDYLASSGLMSNLFEFHTNGYVHTQIMDNFYHEIGNINFIQSLPIKTYRDEVLLLIQLKNSSLLALSWFDLQFKPVFIPNEAINDFNLAKVTIIPNFGFLSGNSFVKFQTKLNYLTRSEENEIRDMLQVKFILKDILDKQESIIMELNSMVEPRYSDDSEINEDSNTTESEEILSDENYIIESIEELNDRLDEVERDIRDIQLKNATEIVLQDIDINGDLEVKGSLTVDKLTVGHINGIPWDAFINECSRTANTKIHGLKSFPTINFTEGNLKIKNLNGIPMKDIVFGESTEPEFDFDFSKISKLQINGNLNVETLCGVDWENLTKKLVFKDKDRIIDGDVIVLGDVTANVIYADYLNGIKYPSGYIQKSGPEDANMTDDKYFEILTVSDIQGVQTINGIDADDFIILHANQTLDHLITFENLVIDESLQIDGEITGIKQDINPDLTILNSNTVEANTMFTKLTVTGKIYVENYLNGTKWSELDDLILNDEENVVVTGTKTFLGNVHIEDKLEIRTRMINGHLDSDFITLDTEQVLPNLSKISGNVKFEEVSYKELRDFERKLSESTSAANNAFTKKTLIFKEPPVIDELVFARINGNVTSSEFNEKWKSLLKDVYFERLNVENLVVENLETTMVNNINIDEFKNQVITKNDYQNITGNITIKYLEVDQLYADTVNNRSAKDLENTVNRINMFYDDIFKGKILVDTLNVTKTVRTPKINSQDLNDVLDVNNIETLIFPANKSIDNVVVEGLLNNLNFTKKVQDCVLKSDDNVVITGRKKIRKLKAQNLYVEYINGHHVSDIVSADKDQVLTGPIKIKGSVNVLQSFNSTGKINEVPFKDFNVNIKHLSDDIYQLTGDFEVYDDAVIEDLHAHGQIQHTDINDFLDNIIYLSDKEIEVTGEKIFINAVSITNVTVTHNLNEIDLATFYKTAVLIDRPISIHSKVIFEDDIILEGDLIVSDNLKVKTINGVDIDDLLENAVYKNRPTSIMEAATFSNVIFKSDIKVDQWNDVKLNTLFTLNNNEAIRGTLKCVDVVADNLEILGFVNGENLTEIYETTFMLSTQQYITGRISFLNNIYMKKDFNSRYINNIDMTKTISLSDADPMIGDFVFENPVIVKKNLEILGNLNDVDFSKWKSSVITTNSSSKQRFFGKWTVHGNVYIKKNFRSSGSINGVNIQNFTNCLKKQNMDTEMWVSNKMRELRKVCKDLQVEKDVAENVLQKYKAFEYYRILKFNERIVSVHHFEMNNKDYIMVNFESCDLDIFANTNQGLVFVVNYSSFGYINQYTAFNYNENVYFITVGRSKCGRSPGNLWSFENSTINHIFDLGNVTDVEKFGSDGFLITADRLLQEWSFKNIWENSFQPLNVISLEEKNIRFFSNENKILLISSNKIYYLKSDVLELEEFVNPFHTNKIMSFQAGIFKREYILSYDDQISDDYIYIHNSNLFQHKILQTISTYKPNSFLVLNFDKFQENLLIFSENKRKIQIYEYKGIEGFKYHSSIKQKIDKLYHFNMRINPYFTKSRFLAIVQANELKLLEAKMYGERLGINQELICD